jgi:hypothetical protein
MVRSGPDAGLLDFRQGRWHARESKTMETVRRGTAALSRIGHVRGDISLTSLTSKLRPKGSKAGGGHSGRGRRSAPTVLPDTAARARVR